MSLYRKRFPKRIGHAARLKLPVAIIVVTALLALASNSSPAAQAEIRSINPSQGSIAGGTQVTLVGSGLTGTTLTLDENIITPTSASDTRIVLTTTPSGASIPGPGSSRRSMAPRARASPAMAGRHRARGFLVRCRSRSTAPGTSTSSTGETSASGRSTRAGSSPRLQELESPGFPAMGARRRRRCEPVDVRRGTDADGQRNSHRSRSPGIG